MSSPNDEAPRIVCVGAHLESQIALEGMLKSGVPIVGVVTLDRRRKAGVCDYADLFPLCERFGVRCVETADINDDATKLVLKSFRPDYIFVLGWNRLFGSELLNLPRHFCVGSHPSALPEGRGRAPIPWTILTNQKQSAVSLFRMDEQADHGELLIQKEFPVSSGIYAGELYQRAAECMRDAFLEFYDALLQGRPFVGKTTTDRESSFRAKRSPEDGHLDFRQMPAETVDRLIRAVSEPYPGAYAYYQKSRIQIWRAGLEGCPKIMGVPGQVLLVEHERVLVQASDRPLWISSMSHLGEPVEPSQFRVGSKFGFAVEDKLFDLQQKIRRLEEQLCYRFVNES